MDPQTRQKIKGLLEEGSHLVAEIGGLTGRFSSEALFDFNFEGWSQRVGTTMQELHQFGPATQ
jgi:hypothetical protein